MASCDNICQSVVGVRLAACGAAEAGLRGKVQPGASKAGQ